MGGLFSILMGIFLGITGDVLRQSSGVKGGFEFCGVKGGFEFCRTV